MSKLFMIVLALSVAACAVDGDGRNGEKQAADVSGSLPDSQVGLYKGSVFEVATPDPVNVNETAPGDGEPAPRPYPIAPPVVPHVVAGLPPITAEANMCALCHAVEEQVEGGATPIPESHYVDGRRAPGEVGETLAGARYNCTACHAATTDALPLVANDAGAGL